MELLTGSLTFSADVPAAATGRLTTLATALPPLVLLVLLPVAAGFPLLLPLAAALPPLLLVLTVTTTLLLALLAAVRTSLPRPLLAPVPLTVLGLAGPLLLLALLPVPVLAVDRDGLTAAFIGPVKGACCAGTPASVTSRLFATLTTCFKVLTRSAAAAFTGVRDRPAPPTYMLLLLVGMPRLPSDTAAFPAADSHSVLD
jgi:hypothetical protein